MDLLHSLPISRTYSIVRLKLCHEKAHITGYPWERFGDIISRFIIILSSSIIYHKPSCQI
jgi:hypothetical protein